MKVVFLFPFLMSITTYCFATIGESVGSLATIGNTHTNVVLSIGFSNDSLALNKLVNWKKMYSSTKGNDRLNSLDEARDYLRNHSLSDDTHRLFFVHFLNGVKDEEPYLRSRAIAYANSLAKESDFNEAVEKQILELCQTEALYVDRLFLICARFKIESVKPYIQFYFASNSKINLFESNIISADHSDWSTWNAAIALSVWGDAAAVQFLLKTCRRLLMVKRSFVLSTLTKRLLNAKKKLLANFVIEEFIYSDYCGKSDVLSCDYEVASFLLLYPTIAEFKAFVDGYFAKSQTPSKAQIQTWFQENRDTWTYAEN